MAVAMSVAGCANDSDATDSTDTDTADTDTTDTDTVGPATSDPGAVEPRAEDPDLDDLDVVVGRLAGAGALVDLYRPTENEPRASVVVFGDSRVPASGYAALAARLAETAGVAVGIADRIEPDQAAAASGCVVETTAVWAAEGLDSAQALPLPIVVVGLGDGAVPAIGEGLDGIWASWSGGGRCSFERASTPVVLAVVAGALRAVPPGSSAESLDPFDQVGGNPYLQVRTLLGSDGSEVEDGALSRFHEVLVEGSYDTQTASSTLSTNELFGGGGSAGPTESAVDEIVALVLDTFVFTDGA